MSKSKAKPSSSAKLLAAGVIVLAFGIAACLYAYHVSGEKNASLLSSPPILPPLSKPGADQAGIELPEPPPEAQPQPATAKPQISDAKLKAKALLASSQMKKLAAEFDANAKQIIEAQYHYMTAHPDMTDEESEAAMTAMGKNLSDNTEKVRTTWKNRFLPDAKDMRDDLTKRLGSKALPELPKQLSLNVSDDDIFNSASIMDVADYLEKSAKLLP